MIVKVRCDRDHIVRVGLVNFHVDAEMGHYDEFVCKGFKFAIMLQDGYRNAEYGTNLVWRFLWWRHICIRREWVSMVRRFGRCHKWNRWFQHGWEILGKGTSGDVMRLLLFIDISICTILWHWTKRFCRIVRGISRDPAYNIHYQRCLRNGTVCLRLLLPGESVFCHEIEWFGAINCSLDSQSNRAICGEFFFLRRSWIWLSAFSISNESQVSTSALICSSSSLPKLEIGGT